VTRRWQDEYVSISKMLQTLIQRVKEGSG
jgi:hypothetical protein